LILHGFPRSHNSRKVLATAAHLGLALELREVNLLAKESFTPAFRKLNPNGLTPVLEDAGMVLWESQAIMQYLASKVPDNTLWPADPRARAEVDQWLAWNGRHWDPTLDPIVIEKLVRPLEGHATDDAVVARCEAAAAPLVALLDAHLADRPFVAKSGFSLADIALASLLAYHPLAPLPIDGRPHLLAWYERICRQPAWQASEPNWLSG
jgi:glutathione S-transferase